MKIYRGLTDSLAKDLKFGEIHSVTSTKELMTRYSSWSRDLSEDLIEAFVRFFLRQALLMRGREIGRSLVAITEDKKFRWQIDHPGLDEMQLKWHLLA